VTLLPPPLGARLPGPERMDDLDALGGEELRGALAGLRAINRWLGGGATTRRGLDDLAARVPLGPGLEVLDVGGGSGDAAPVILDWARRRGLRARVVVLDLHPETAREAARHLRGVEGAEARQGDLFEVPPGTFDVVHAGLFLHHFDGPEAARALRAMAGIARRGVVVNDLHRHPVPWLLIRWLTLAASRNEALRHDAPLSVARAFTAADWRALGPPAGLDLRSRRSFAWRWAVSGVRP
jgi:SAM-dependent methyltransferase